MSKLDGETQLLVVRQTNSGVVVKSYDKVEKKFKDGFQIVDSVGVYKSFRVKQ